MLKLPALPPTLKLRDVCLRGLVETDATALLQYLSDPFVIEHTSLPFATPASVANLITSARRNYADGVACKLAISAVPTDILVGTCGFTNWSLEHEWAELAYDLARPYWGRGFAFQAVSAILAWAFCDVGFRRTHAIVMTSNLRSQRLLERVGFLREGTLRSYRLCRGAARDFYIYGLLASEWSTRSGT